MAHDLDNQHAVSLLVQELIESKDFLTELADSISDLMINKLNKASQFGFIKRYGSENQLVVIKQHIDVFVAELMTAINNDINVIANELFDGIKND